MAVRDHGGNLDAAIAQFGGGRANWLDLSTGINPEPYPVGPLSGEAWTALPDRRATERLLDAAREFWNVPKGMSLLAAPGASALIARLPSLWPADRVQISTRTYNEHRAAFEAERWQITENPAPVRVVVHPNNPDGAWWNGTPGSAFTILDESFCDIAPERSAVSLSDTTIVLKSFGKFWGLAGLRLGFAIGPEPLLSQLRERLGPWAVSGAALEIGTRALSDYAWATATRDRLQADALRLDRLFLGAGATCAGGTTLFRLYEVDNAAVWQARLAEGRIWTRIFPYSPNWLRVGLPPSDGWPRLEAAL